VPYPQVLTGLPKDQAMTLNSEREESDNTLARVGLSGQERGAIEVTGVRIGMASKSIKK